MTAKVGRNGLLFPEGAPPRRTSRVPLLLAGIVLGAGGVWFMTKGESAPEPVAMVLPRQAAAAAPPQTATATAPRTEGAPPTSWEELVASREAARANAPRPTPPAAPAAAPREDDEPERRQRRETRRREPAPRPAESLPPPPAVSAPPSESAAPGRLSASSTPWGQLIIDGRVYGNTPRVNLPIAVGTHRVRIARDGFAPYDTTITVEPGEAIRITGITLREQP